jgi:hypothetical protein
MVIINFELEILEAPLVSDVFNLLKREQHYLDSLNPIYNIAKIAARSHYLRSYKV